MQIPLHEFEQVIDESILQRGLSYFKKGLVMEPEELEPGLYEAIVKGTENYTLRLRLKNEIITEYYCDCPYDMGPVCKHVAALIFYLQQDELGIQQKAPAKKTKQKSTTKKGITHQVDALLDKLSFDELKEFIRKQASADPSIKRIFLATYAHLSEKETKKLYAKQIKAILKNASGRLGYIERRAARLAGLMVKELTDTAQSHVKNGNYKSALMISFAVLEEITEALQFADDSSGELGENINNAYHLILDLSLKNIPEEIRKELLLYTLNAFETKIFFGWDWHIGMMEIASLLLVDDTEAKKIFELLDQVERGTFDFEFRKAQNIKLQILKKTKGEKDVTKFIEQNLDNPYIRHEAIQNEIDNTNYNKAIKLAKDGVEHDLEERPGLAMDWYDCLLRISIEQKDTKKIIEYARLLFVDSIKERQQYYELLKNTVDKKQWNSFVEKLVNDINNKSVWLNFDLIAQIYVIEESWIKLMTLLKEEFTNGNISLDHIVNYEKYLVNQYPKELARLYEDGVIELLADNTGRNHYKDACRYIRRMIKVGAKEEADALVNTLKQRYRQRYALIEELSGI